MLLATALAIAGALVYTWNLVGLVTSPDPPHGAAETLQAFWFDVTKSDWRAHLVASVPRGRFGDRLAMYVFDLRQQFGIAGIAVATDSDDVAEAAIAHGASVIFDPPKHGGPSFAAILDRGLDLLAALGAGAAAVVMADLPRLVSDDVAALIAGLDGADVVLAPDRYQLGTNALALALPASLATCFGHGDSYARHLAPLPFLPKRSSSPCGLTKPPPHGISHYANLTSRFA